MGDNSKTDDYNRLPSDYVPRKNRVRSDEDWDVEEPAPAPLKLRGSTPVRGWLQITDGVARLGIEKKDGVKQIAVYGHSSLFYWWPVWLVCFILAGVTYTEGDRSGGVTVSNTNVPGLIFVLTLLAVAISSTVILRGMVSVVAVISLIAVALALSWFGWWGTIFGFLGGLEIRINAAGHLCIGIPLFVAWAVVIGVYDRLHHVTFGQGQIRYVLEVGDGEVVMPSGGAVVEKKRNDAFRHWVLGMGSGDLLIRSVGPNSPTIELKNVLFIHRKLAVIDRLLREKAVTVG